MTVRKRSKALVAASLLGLALPSSPGLSEDTVLKIGRLASFKNGLGFVGAKATLPKNAKTVRLGPVPVPAFGTFWLDHPESVRVKSLQAGMESIADTAPVQSLAEFLALNTGKRVALHLASGTVDGTILTAVAERPAESSTSARIAPFVPGVILLQTDQGIVALNSGTISRVDVPGKDAVTLSRTTRQVPVLTLNLSQPSAGETVDVTYLAKGFTWAPSYLIDITDQKTARFVAKAAVINELADLENATLELVTGFPNIRFGDVPSPMDLKQSLSEFLNAVASESSPWSSRSVSRRPGVLTQQAVLSNVAYSMNSGGSDASFSARDLAQVDGVASEDLFFYSVPGFTLPKGGRAEVTLLSASLPYRHIYTWAVGDTLDESERRTSEPEAADDVWHSARLSNSLNMPLTTAPALFLKEGRIAGQDICYYTPRGAETTIRINKALNVVTERIEIEVERKRNAESFHGSTYDLVKVKGELRIKSRLGQAARVEVRKELSGRMLSMQPEGKDTKTAQGLKKVNPKHVVLWEIDVNSGEEKKIAYSYEVYVRS